jgi:hypothetical protein
MIDAILQALRGKRTGPNAGLVCCPVPSHGRGHGDRHPSLSISIGDDGRPLVHCFSGCDPADVLAALAAINFDSNSDKLRQTPTKLRQAHRREWRGCRP